MRRHAMSNETPGKSARRGWLQRIVDALFRTAGSPAISDISASLWAEAVSDADAAYRSAVLEQYKIYVEMADRISARRGLTNTFFLTLNTAIFTLIGVFWQLPPSTTA